MIEKEFIDLLKVLGEKIYELQTGLAAMYNLCLHEKVFSEPRFQAELAKVAGHGDLKALRNLLDRLSNSMGAEDLAEFLRKSKRPVQ